MDEMTIILTFNQHTQVLIIEESKQVNILRMVF